MKWTLIRSWAKEKGYKITREKSGDKDNPYIYNWSSPEWTDPITPNTTILRQIHGVCNSLSEVTTVIYNHMTNNAQLAYQQEYRALKAKQEIRYDGTV